MRDVQEIDLDAFIKFVGGAKESGRNAGRYLGSGEAEVSQVTGYSLSDITTALVIGRY